MSDERLCALAQAVTEWRGLKLRRLTLGDIGQLEQWVADAPLRKARTAEERAEAWALRVKRDLGNCWAEIDQIENLQYILWLAARRENPAITPEAIGDLLPATSEALDECARVARTVLVVEEGDFKANPTATGENSSAK